MLNREEIAAAVELQQRSYRLLKWMADAVNRGFVTFDTAHEYSSFPEAAKEWILIHYENIPPDARPPKDELSAFCAMFSTYLENSFTLAKDPGVRLHSVGGHCFCQMCSFLVDIPNLQSRKPTAKDKRRARKMKINLLESIAIEEEVILSENSKASIVEDADLRESLSLATYTKDLFNRKNGVAVGPATLVLWRSFAWTPEGSPKHGFELSAPTLFEACMLIRSTVLRVANSER